MPKITENMVTDFNKMLENLNCSFRLKYRGDDFPWNPKCEIVPANSMFISSAIINLTNEFYKTLNAYFNDKGIELSYNNAHSIFWSKSGWN